MTLLGATGTGKTMTMAGDDRAGAAAGARHGPQQDARRAALQRVPDVLPRQRGRVLRLLLRLLPARGLRPVAGPLHREGLGDQPGDRPAAPRRDGRAVRAARRDHRRLGVGDLRPRLAGDLRRRTARCCVKGGDVDRDELLRKLVSIQYTRNDTALGRGTFRVRGDTLEVFPAYAETAFRATFFGDEVERLQHFDPLTGELIARRPRARRDLAGDALQRQGGHDRGRGRGDRRASSTSAAPSSRPRASCSSRHRLRQRTQYDMEMLREVGLLLRHRELLAHPRRPHARRPAVLPDRLLPRRTSSASSTSRTRPCRRSAACTRATARASRRSSTTASGCPARWTTGRRRSTSSCRSRRSSCSCRPRPGEYERDALRAHRRADRPPDRHRRPRGRGARDAQPDRRPDERDPRAGRARRARAGHHAHEEDVRGPHGLPARDGLQGPLPALGDRHARAHPDHPRAAPGRVRRARRRQPPARGARPARRSRSSRSSTPTRRASCAGRRR